MVNLALLLNTYKKQVMLKFIPFILLLSVASKSCNQTPNEEQVSKEAMEKTTQTTDFSRLHDIWALSAIAGQAVNSELFPQGVPNMEIYLSDQQINGFGGCNNYFAKIETINERQFILGPISATKKMCIGVNEAYYFRQLNKVDAYALNKMQLDMFKGDSLLLSFIKVD